MKGESDALQQRIGEENNALGTGLSGSTPGNFSLIKKVQMVTMQEGIKPPGISSTTQNVKDKVNRYLARYSPRATTSN